MRPDRLFSKNLLEENVNINPQTIVIDESVYNLLMDNNVSQEVFLSRVLTNRVMKSKFLMLVGLQNKISRLEKFEFMLDKLSKELDNRIENGSMRTEDMVRYYKTLTIACTQDLIQIKGMQKEFLETLSKV